MKVIDKIYSSGIEPKTKNVLWLDTISSKLKYLNNGVWSNLNEETVSVDNNTITSKNGVLSIKDTILKKGSTNLRYFNFTGGDMLKVNDSQIQAYRVDGTQWLNVTNTKLLLGTNDEIYFKAEYKESTEIYNTYLPKTVGIELGHDSNYFNDPSGNNVVEAQNSGKNIIFYKKSNSHAIDITNEELQLNCLNPGSDSPSVKITNDATVLYSPKASGTFIKLHGQYGNEDGIDFNLNSNTVFKAIPKYTSVQYADSDVLKGGYIGTDNDKYGVSLEIPDGTPILTAYATGEEISETGKVYLHYATGNDAIVLHEDIDEDIRDIKLLASTVRIEIGNTTLELDEYKLKKLIELLEN